MKERISRLDWFSFYPSDFVNAPDVLLMSSAARGAYISMLSHCWLNAENGCDIPGDEKYLRMITNCSRKEWKSVKDEVLPKFNQHPTTLRLTNDRLQKELSQIKTNSATQATSASVRWEPNPLCNQQKKDATALQSQCESNAKAMPKDDMTIHDMTIHESIGQLCDDVTASTEPKQTIVGMDSNGRRKSEPGYYERGQYPATDPKKIFKFMQEKWCEVKGEAAYIRYPAKYPEPWKELCDNVSSDLIVPAFELWCEKQGRFMSTAWPVSEFLRSSQEFLAMVKPLGEAVPRITKEQLDASKDVAKKGHEEVWGTPTSAAAEIAATLDEVKREADPASMFEEDSK